MNNSRQIDWLAQGDAIDESLCGESDGEVVCIMRKPCTRHSPIELDDAPVGPKLCSEPKSLRQRFDAFDQANPEVWRAFRSKALKLIHVGVRYYSASAIIEVIRFNKVIKSHDPDGFKVNNDYRAAYARKFVREYPQHAHFFRMRRSELDQ